MSSGQALQSSIAGGCLVFVENGLDEVDDFVEVVGILVEDAFGDFFAVVSFVAFVTDSAQTVE